MIWKANKQADNKFTSQKLTDCHLSSNAHKFFCSFYLALYHCCCFIIIASLCYLNETPIRFTTFNTSSQTRTRMNVSKSKAKCQLENVQDMRGWDNRLSSPPNKQKNIGWPGTGRGGVYAWSVRWRECKNVLNAKWHERGKCNKTLDLHTAYIFFGWGSVH